MYGYFTNEQAQWISDHIDGKNWPQITEEYNSHFASDIKVATFRYRCIRDGFVQKKKTGGIVEFTEEQDEWLKANHKQSWDSMTDQFNLIFGTSYNREKIRKHCGRYLGLTSEQTRQQYQKQLPLYSERYNAKDDVIEIKVCDEIGKCKWIPKHHYIWELETGMKIPPNCKIIHLDGNRRNNDISNLICVSNSVMISARKQFNWDVKNKHYRLCAIYDAQLKMLLRE
ncbi:MAG: HNH endonuclease signature motif containing protein [Treponema sp.]|nr:HNH endonuclease signature motif containing protein [Treponema sp.]